MALKNDRYTYRVTWSEGDHEYVGLCAELSSLSWLAKTPEAALKGIRKVVADMVDKKKHNIKWDVSSSLISWTDPLSAY